VIPCAWRGDRQALKEAALAPPEVVSNGRVKPRPPAKKSHPQRL
jgi:hypothetical protein